MYRQQIAKKTSAVSLVGAPPTADGLGGGVGGGGNPPTTQKSSAEST